MPEGGSQTLERGLAVLLEIRRHPGGLTTAEIAEACHLHRSITHRLLISLQHTDFVSRDEHGRYSIGPTARSLGGSGRSLREVAEPILDRLAGEIDASAALVEIHDSAAITTLVAEPPTNGPRFSYRLGNRDPLDRGAGGLAALASGPVRTGEPPRVTDIRAAGYVSTHGELNPGAYGIAAPLPGWPVLASINVVTLEEELTRSAVGPLLRAVADMSRRG